MLPFLCRGFPNSTTCTRPPGNFFFGSKPTTMSYGSSKEPVLPPAKEDAVPESAVMHRSLTSRPHVVVSASGSWLTLKDGSQKLDACGGAAVALIGHGNAEVTRAAVAQMNKVSYVHTMQYSTDSAEELAQCILQPHPSSPHFDHGLVKAFFVGSGSEANDAALKCAKQYWVEKGKPQRRVYIARKQAYHGGTIGAMSVSGMPARKGPYEDILMPNVEFVGAADAFHRKGEDETEAEFVDRLMVEIEEVFEKAGAENIISFVGEPVSGAALGAMPAPTGYWPAVRALCDKHGILLHLDEIMCGMGRTGTYFAFEQEGIKPDIVTIGKGLGGGYAPISAMLVNDKIVEALRQGTSSFNHGHTFQSHPVNCAIALQVQQIVKRERLVERSEEKGEILAMLLEDAFRGAEYVAEIRGRGLFRTVEFMLDPRSKTPFPKGIEFGTKVQTAAFDLGVATYPGMGTVDGVVGDHVLVAPPFNVSDEEMRFTVSTMRKAYEEMVARMFIAKL